VGAVLKRTLAALMILGMCLCALSFVASAQDKFALDSVSRESFLRLVPPPIARSTFWFPTAISSGTVYVDTANGVNNGTCGLDISPTSDACATVAYVLASRLTTLTGAVVIQAVGATVSTNGWNITGHSTTATNTLTIQGDPSIPFTGVWNNLTYHLVTSGAAVPVTISEGYVYLDHLQIKTPTSSVNAIVTSGTAATPDIRLSNSIVWAPGAASAAISPGGTYAAGLSMWNDIVIGGAYGLVANTNLTLTAYSSDFIGGTYGTATLGTTTFKNCYASGATKGYYGTPTLTTSASSDHTSGSAGLRDIAYSTDNFVVVTGGSEDLRLSASSALRAASAHGTNTHSDTDPFNFTTYIDRTARDTGATYWDIGPQPVAVPDTTNPDIEITTPIVVSLALTGLAADNVGISSVTWTCDICSVISGSASYDSGTHVWAAPVILGAGINTIGVTATDSSGNTIVITKIIPSTGSALILSIARTP
jgi:hypothetical protein